MTSSARSCDDRPASTRPHAPAGPDPDAGGGRVHRHRPAGRLAAAGRERCRRGLGVHRALRAGRAGDARPARPPPHLRRPGADRRRLPALRRGTAGATAGRRDASGRPVGRSQRGRRRAALDHRDAVTGDVAAGCRLGAAAGDGRDSPRRGAAASVAGRDGGRDHRHRRRDEADLPVRVGGRSEACRVGRRLPQRAAGGRVAGRPRSSPAAVRSGSLAP